MDVTRRTINHAYRFKDYRASHRMERTETDGANGQLFEKPFDDETLAVKGGNGPDYTGRLQGHFLFALESRETSKNRTISRNSEVPRALILWIPIYLKKMF